MNRYIFSFIGDEEATREELAASIASHDLSVTAHKIIQDVIAKNKTLTDAEKVRLDNELANIAQQFQQQASRISAKINISEKGVANGVATLDASGVIPLSQMNINALRYKGCWNAETNTPKLTNISGLKDDFYIISVGGSIDLGDGVVLYEVGSNLVHNGTKWEQIKCNHKVLSVNGAIGDIIIDKASIGLGNVDNTSDADKPLSTILVTLIDDIKAQLANCLINGKDEIIFGKKTFKDEIKFETPFLVSNPDKMIENLYSEKSNFSNRFAQEVNITLGKTTKKFRGDADLTFTEEEIGAGGGGGGNINFVILTNKQSEDDVPAGTLIFRKNS